MSETTAATVRAPRRFWQDRSFVAIVALWSLAVAQPLLDLFGKSPEFFVANGFSRLEILLMAVVVVVSGPIVLYGLHELARFVSPAAVRVVHYATVALLGALLALSVLRQLDVDDVVIVAGIAVLAGFGIAHAEATVAGVRTALRYLMFSPLLFLVAFAVLSPTAELIWHPGVEDVEAGRVGSPAPVVFLSLDEFPVASLLRPDGTINEERFPNFARLADSATWYRNATSVSNETVHSVPATLTGTFPDPDALPTAGDHPRSLFTLLEDDYDEWVREQVTDVCPGSVCPNDTGLLDLDRLWSGVADSAAVYGHLVTPASLRDHLPVVDRSWGGFVAGGDDGGGGAEAFASRVEDAIDGEETSGRGPLAPDPDCPDAAMWCGPARVGELAAAVDEPDDERPDLWMVHATTPHSPWMTTPQGHQYLPRAIESFDFAGLAGEHTWVGDYAWGDDEVLVRQGFQRHVLQVGALDRQLGTVLDALEDAGLWDDALVVVVADHGVAFTPGQPLRRPVSVTNPEIFHVPLFIKAPQQDEGEVDDGNALTIDVLPTIVDLLDIETDWEMDGESLAADDHREDKPVLVNGETSALSTDVDDVLAVARRNREYLPYGQDWQGVTAVGVSGDLVGRSIGEVDTSGAPAGSWTSDQDVLLADWDPDGAAAPVLLQGTLTTTATAPPAEGLVVLNGTVAGVAVDFHAVRNGVMTFSAVLAEEHLRAGLNEVQLLLPTTAGGTQYHVVPRGV